MSQRTVTESLLVPAALLLSTAIGSVAAGQCLIHEDQLLVPGGVVQGDQSGRSIDVAGDVAIVGAAGDDDNGSNAGAAFVFRRIDGAWVEEQKLLAGDGTASDAFGVSVGIDGDVCVVGASGDSDVVSVGGATYVFRFTNGTWTQEAKLVAPGVDPGDTTGSKVAVSGDTVITCSDNKQVGFHDDAGAVFVYRFGGSSWGLEQTLTASDAGGDDYFGWSAAIRDDALIVGAIGHDGDVEFDRGAAYVFRRSGSSWNEEQRLTPSDGAGEDQFGYDVALDGDLAVVGSNRHGIVPDAGAVYVYRRNGGAWAEQQKLTGHDSAAYDRLGTRVDVDAGHVVAHAPLDDDAGSNSGAVFVFREVNSTWVEQTKFIGSNTNTADSFGEGLALSGMTVLATSVSAVNGHGAIYSAELPDLSLDAQPEVVSGGTPLDLFVGGGAPFAPMALLITGVNGGATSIFLLTAPLDADGGWSLALPNAPSLPASTITLQAFAEDSPGVIVASHEETLSFQ